MKMQESAKSRLYFLSLHMNLRPYSLSIWRFVLFLLDQSYCTAVKMFSALWNQDVSTYMPAQASHASWKLRDKISDVKLNIRVAHTKFQSKRFILAIIHNLTNRDTNFMCKTSSVYLFVLNIYDLWLLETTWIVLMASVLRMSLHKTRCFAKKLLVNQCLIFIERC